MRITVLALDQVFDTRFTVLIDALPIANNLSVRAMGRESPFELSVAGVQRLDESRMLVPTDTGVTASAAMRHLDLAL